MLNRIARMMFCLLGLVSCVVGCDIPMAKQPFGTPWKTNEVVKFNGAWVIAGQDQPMTFLASKNGEGQLGFIQTETVRKDGIKEVMKLVTAQCAFTHVGTHEMLFFKGDEDEKEKDGTTEPEGYVFLLITKREPNKLSIAGATDQFEKLIKAGKLGGKIVEGSKTSYPLIDCDEKTFLSVVESIGIDKCFETKNPMVIERIVAKK